MGRGPDKSTADRISFVREMYRQDKTITPDGLANMAAEKFPSPGRSCPMSVTMVKKIMKVVDLHLDLNELTFSALRALTDRLPRVDTAEYRHMLERVEKKKDSSSSKKPRDGVTINQVRGDLKSGTKQVLMAAPTPIIEQAKKVMFMLTDFDHVHNVTITKDDVYVDLLSRHHVRRAES